MAPARRSATAAVEVDALSVVSGASARAGHAVFLGELRAGDSAGSGALAPGALPVFARPEHAVLVLGPPRSGKTAAVVVPNVVAANGPVVCASTKADVLAATSPARGRRGHCGLFDPSGAVACPPGVTRVAWSPLLAAHRWDRAVLVADAMVRAARRDGDRGESAHWSERAGALLATAFHAAALDGRQLNDVVRLVDRHDPGEVRTALARHDANRALDLFEGIVATDGREQSGIWSTASGVLAAYRTDAAVASSVGQPMEPEAFVSSTDTLYICAGSDFQHQAAPIVAGLVRDVRSAAYDAAATTGRLGRPPLLLVLDELANIAPLHDLPELVSEGASQGVVTLACLQDLSQARARWGVQADGFLSLFGTKLVLAGIADTRTLEAISLLAGERDVPSASVTRPAARSLFGRRAAQATRTVSLRRTRTLPVEAIARGEPGRLLALDGTVPGSLALAPWHATSPWREAVGGARLVGPERTRRSAPERALRGGPGSAGLER